MFVLFLLLTTVSALNLTQFEHFKIELDANSKEYFLFQGEKDYMYFYQRNGQFELWLTQDNTTYEIYTSTLSDTLIFEWPSKLINNNPMNLTLYEGKLTYPLKFNSEIFSCKIYGISTGSLNYEEPVLELFKCPPSKSWIINVIVCLIALILVLLGVKHGTIKALLGPEVSWIIRWSRTLLPRSSQTISSDDSETDQAISQDSESLYLP